MTYKSPGVLVVGGDGFLHDLGQGVDDVLRYEVIGEALAQVQRLVVKVHLHELHPEDEWLKKFSHRIATRNSNQTFLSSPLYFEDSSNFLLLDMLRL